MNSSSSEATPTGSPIDRSGSVGGSSREPAWAFDWSIVVPLLIHPTKVAIVEALRWLDRPLSSSEIAALFDDEKYHLSLISYHAGKLARVGVLEVRRTRQVRGALEKFYFFTAATPA